MKRHKNTAALACLLSFFISFNSSVMKPLFSGEVNDVTYSVLEDGIIDSFYKGDFKKICSGIEKLLLNYPVEPGSFLFYYDLNRLADIYGYGRVELVLKKLITIGLLNTFNSNLINNIYNLVVQND